jgi:hypothetical protein
LRETAQRHYLEGKADYAPFIESYISRLDRTDPNYILAAAPIAGRRSVRYDHATKQIMVRVDGRHELPWEAAVKQKLISIK